jgi:hypothetical protein
LLSYVFWRLNDEAIRRRGMRVIRTEMYFAEADISGREKSAAIPGIAAAWLRTPSGTRIDAEVLSKQVFDPKSPQAILKPGVIDIFKSFADLCVRDITDPKAVDHILSGKWDIKNTAVVQSIVDSSLVIENSPVDLITIKDAIKGASFISIGSLVGYQALSTPLLFIFVPAGIFVVGITITMTQVVQKIITDHFSKK